MSAELVLDCSACGGPRRFEQPPCPDGHGADCPDLACVECGSALCRASAALWQSAQRAGARAA